MERVRNTTKNFIDKQNFINVCDIILINKLTKPGMLMRSGF